MDGRVNTFAAGPQSNIAFVSADAQSLSTRATWFEIGLVFAAIMVAIWTPLGLANTAATLIAILSILWFTATGPYTFREMGFGLPATGSLVALVTGIGFAALIGTTGIFICSIFGPAHPVPLHRAWGYAIWAIVQEFILQGFFYLRMKSLFGHRQAVWWTASLFAVAHLPSPLLTLLSFAGALLFCELFYRYRALVAIGLIHGLLGLTIAASLPDNLLHHMRVGIGFLMYHP